MYADSVQVSHGICTRENFTNNEKLATGWFILLLSLRFLTVTTSHVISSFGMFKIWKTKCEFLAGPTITGFSRPGIYAPQMETPYFTIRYPV